MVKTLAKPVSKRIKHEFNRTQPTRQFLNNIGQASHQVTSRLTIWSAGYKVKQITQLPTEEAIKIGSEFVGESFVLIVSAATVLYEYNRSKEKEEKKSTKKLEEAEAERAALQEQLHAINVRLLALEGAEILEQHHHRRHHSQNQHVAAAATTGASQPLLDSQHNSNHFTFMNGYPFAFGSPKNNTAPPEQGTRVASKDSAVDGVACTSFQSANYERNDKSSATTSKSAVDDSPQQTAPPEPLNSVNSVPPTSTETSHWYKFWNWKPK